MEAAMDGISVLDAAGEYQYMNRAHADVFGYEPEDLVGCSWRRLYHPDDADRLESEVVPTLERTGTWRGETVGRTRDGGAVHVETSVSLLDDGTRICTVRDITEQRRRERELDATKERYESLFENNPLAIWEEDFSETKQYLDRLRARTDVDSVEAYLLAHPEELRRVLETVEVIDVNQNALEIYGADSKDELLGNVDRLFRGVRRRRPR
jgi:PAS domain S-box-containing protein